MPELPELVVFARQVGEKMKGKRITLIEATQPKNLNTTPEDFTRRLTGATILEVTSRGKWLRLDLDTGESLFINFGMGGAIRYYEPGGVPGKKPQFRLETGGGDGFVVRFSWFGHLHLARTGDPQSHKPTAGLGPGALSPEVTRDFVAALLRRGPKMAVRRLLLDQKRLSGIGNGASWLSFGRKPARSTAWSSTPRRRGSTSFSRTCATRATRSSPPFTTGRTRRAWA
jgi:formamidopyrimidine-DNA glycosylase